MMTTETETTYTTKQVAELTGVSERKLRDWQRDGKVTPEAEGDGRARRIKWSADDVEQVKALDVDQLPPEIHAYLRPVIEYLDQAQRRQNHVQHGQIVTISARGVRVMQRRDTLSEMIERADGDCVLVLLK